MIAIALVFERSSRRVCWRWPRDFGMRRSVTLKACRGCHYLNSALKVFVLDALCAKRKWNNNVTRAQPCLTNVKSYCQNSVQNIQNVQFSMVSIQLMIWNRWVAGADATNEKLVIIKVLKHFQEHVLRAKPCLSLTKTLVRTKPE